VVADRQDSQVRSNGQGDVCERASVVPPWARPVPPLGKYLGKGAASP
jgi:hypothetical protein